MYLGLTVRDWWALHQYCHNKSKGGSRPTSHIPYPLGLQFFLLYLFLTLHALSQLYSTVCLHSTTWFFCFYFFPSATLKKKNTAWSWQSSSEDKSSLFCFRQSQSCWAICLCGWVVPPTWAFQTGEWSEWTSWSGEQLGLGCNINVLLLEYKQALHYQHQFLFPFIKKTTFFINKKAIISQLEYSLDYS